MTDRVIIALPGLGVLALDVDTFQSALASGTALAAPPSANLLAGAVSERFLTADECSELTSVPASWFEEKARQGEIPFVSFGKYPRFRMSDLVAVLERRPAHSRCAVPLQVVDAERSEIGRNRRGTGP